MFTGREQELNFLRAALRGSGRAVLIPETQGVGCSRLACEALRELSDIHSAPRIWLDAETELTWCASLLDFATKLQRRTQVLRRPADLLAVCRQWLRQNPSSLIIENVSHLERVSQLLDGVKLAKTIMVSPNPLSEVSDCIRLEPLPHDECLMWLMKATHQSALTQTQQAQLESIAHFTRGIPALLNTIAQLISGPSIHKAEEPKPKNLLDTLSEFIHQAEQESTEPNYELLEFALQRSEIPQVRTKLATIALARGDARHLTSSTLLNSLISSGFLQYCPARHRSHMSTAYHKHLLRNIELPDIISEYGNSESILLTDQLAERTLGESEYTPELLDMIKKGADSALRIGDWYRGAELSTRLSQRLKTTQKLPSIEQGRCLVQIGHCERGGQRYGASSKRLNSSLEFFKDHLAEAAHVLLDLAENDLYELRTHSAIRRLQAVATIHRREQVDGLDLGRARRLFLRGACWLTRGDVEEALPVLERSLAILQKLLPLDDPQVLRVRIALARALYAGNQLDRVEELLRADTALRLTSADVPVSDVAAALKMFGEVLVQNGKMGEAERILDEHYRILTTWLPEKDIHLANAALELARLKSALGRFQAAEPLFRNALSLLIEIFGEGHPTVARANNDLAESLFTQGIYDRAQRILTRALKVQEASLRSNDPAVVRTRNNLAAIQVALGSYAHAERLYKHDLELKRKGNRPLSLAVTLNNLGEVTRSQGRYADAQVFFEEALELRRSHLKGNHPLVAQSQANLGYALLLRGDLTHAEEMFQAALAIRQQALSRNHPHIASTFSCLAQIRILQEDYPAANRFLEQAVQIAEDVYGVNHSQYASLLARLGRVQLRLQRGARAELSLLKSRQVLEKTVGPDHRFFAEALHGLGELWQTEEKYEEAFPALERALTILQSTTDGHRFEIAEIYDLIGQNLLHRGQASLAAERLHSCLTIWRPLLGADAPRVRNAEVKLAEALIAQQNYGAAEAILANVLGSTCYTNWPVTRQINVSSLYADALAGLKRFSEAEAILSEQLARIDGSGDEGATQKLSLASHLAGLKYLQADLAGAEPLIVRCVELATELHGPETPETAKHQENLAGIYFTQGREQEAEELMKQALGTLERHFGAEHPTIQKALTNYAQLLRYQDRGAEAALIENRIISNEECRSHVLDELL